MGRISGWCHVCRLPVRSLNRHLRRHHAITDLPPPTRSATTAAEPQTLTDASAALCTPPAAARTPSASAGYSWTQPEWWTEAAAASEDWMTEPQCSVEPPEAEEAVVASATTEPQCSSESPKAAGASAATAAQAEFAGAPSPGTPVQDEVSEAAVQATSAEPQVINERPAPRLPEPAEARTVLLYATNPAHSSTLRDPLHDITSGDLTFGLRVPGSTTRRQCDCRTCVHHTLRLTIVARDAPIPAAPGVRFVTLPGLQLEPSGDDDQRRLDAHLRNHPEDSLVVCGCAPCALHRNLTKAWLQALLLSPSPVGKLSRRRHNSALLPLKSHNIFPDVPQTRVGGGAIVQLPCTGHPTHSTPADYGTGTDTGL